MTQTTGEEEELCHLLEGVVDYLAQVVLLLVAFGGLWYKRVTEIPQRPVKIWGLDVSKQVFSGLAAHLCNMLIATIVAMDLKKTSPCAWYFVVYMVDTVFGVGITYLFHKLIIRFLQYYVTRSYTVLRSEDEDSDHKSWADYIVQCGDYGNPPVFQAWAAQMSEWVLVTVIARFICGTVIYLLREFILVNIATAIDRLFAGHPHFLLFAVMVLCPVMMNLIQAWIQDNILKWKHRNSPSVKEIETSSL